MASNAEDYLKAEKLCNEFGFEVLGQFPVSAFTFRRLHLFERGKTPYSRSKCFSYRDQRNTMPAPTNKLFWWSFVEFANVVK
jgi:hypothetical protein